MPRRRGTKKIHYTHWTGGGAAAVGQGAGTAAQQVFAAQHLTETLLRFRGNMEAYLDGGQDSNVGVRFSLGLILVPEGTGTTVLWSPITDDDAPWIWTETFGLNYEEAAVDLIQSTGQVSSIRRIIDSKAMRIIRNQEIQCVVENVTTIGAANVGWSLYVRALQGHG